MKANGHRAEWPYESNKINNEMIKSDNVITVIKITDMGCSSCLVGK